MIEKFIPLVQQGIRLALESELDHLRTGRNERNFTGYLAANISHAINSDVIRVDPFYTRHGKLGKRLHGRRIELDIAVHQRYTDRCNLVAIELETINHPKRDDIWKLEGLTAPLGGYGYLVGLYIVFGVGARAGEILVENWYQAGQRIEL